MNYKLNAECLIGWLKERKVPTGLTKQKKKELNSEEKKMDYLLGRYKD